MPKELYSKNDKKPLNSDDMTLVNIKKGDKLYLKYTVTVPQSFLRYLYHKMASKKFKKYTHLCL